MKLLSGHGWNGGSLVRTVVARCRILLIVVVGVAVVAACGGDDPADVVIEPLEGIDFDDDLSRADIGVDDLSDGLVAVMMAGDCLGAYDWFTPLDFVDAVPYEAFESEVCSRLVGARVIRVYRGEPIPSATGLVTTSGYQVGDELLLFQTSEVRRSIGAFEWANRPRDLPPLTAG